MKTRQPAETLREQVPGWLDRLKNAASAVLAMYSLLLPVTVCVVLAILAAGQLLKLYLR